LDKSRAREEVVNAGRKRKKRGHMEKRISVLPTGEEGPNGPSDQKKIFVNASKGGDRAFGRPTKAVHMPSRHDKGARCIHGKNKKPGKGRNLGQGFFIGSREKCLGKKQQKVRHGDMKRGTEGAQKERPGRAN